MRGIWEVMRDFRNPCSILTKSPLLLRDLDLLQEIAAVADVSACLSVPTLDEKAWRATEPHTPNPKARLEAVAELNRAGIPTGVLIAPLMPGVNDAPEQVERIVEPATEANATYIGGQTLFLRGAVREIYFAWLREHRPDLVPRYEKLYAKGAYVSAAEKRKIELAAGAPWALRTYPVRERHRDRGPPVRRDPAFGSRCASSQRKPISSVARASRSPGRDDAGRPLEPGPVDTLPSRPRVASADRRAAQSGATAQLRGRWCSASA